MREVERYGLVPRYLLMMMMMTLTLMISKLGSELAQFSVAR